MDEFLQLIRYDAWGPAVAHWSGRLLGAVTLVLIGWWLARRLTKVVKRTIAHRAGDLALATFLSNAAFGALLIVIFVGALDLAGVPTASVLAAMGAAGLAVGLALKDSLANVASGVLLIVTRPFRAGDFVEAGGKQGTVQNVNLMQTRLVTPDNAEITLPNGQVMNAPITNFTARPVRRIELLITVPYEQDAARAIEVIRERVKGHPLVDPEREPEIVALKLGPAGTEIAARVWVRAAGMAGSQSTILNDVRQALAAGGVELPPPPNVFRFVPQQGPAGSG